MILTQHGRQYVEAIDDEEDGWTERDAYSVGQLVFGVFVFLCVVAVLGSLFFEGGNRRVRSEVQAITGER